MGEGETAEGSDVAGCFANTAKYSHKVLPFPSLFLVDSPLSPFSCVAARGWGWQPSLGGS